MCIQQTDLGCEDDEEEEDDDETEQNGTETEQGENEGEQEEDEEDGQEDDDLGQNEEEEPQNPFVLSLFAVHDDIKAHYNKPTATVCGSTWPHFLGYTGATPEDVWPDVPDAARTLWSVSVPSQTLECYRHKPDSG